VVVDVFVHNVAKVTQSIAKCKEIFIIPSKYFLIAGCIQIIKPHSEPENCSHVGMRKANFLKNGIIEIISLYSNQNIADWEVFYGQ
jgi:hypothetical protein